MSRTRFGILFELAPPIALSVLVYEDAIPLV